MEKFRAYAFDGKYRMPPVICYGAEEAWHYVITQREYFPEIVVEDMDGRTVIKVENHEVVPEPNPGRFARKQVNE
jgi:hypothetical protein